MAYYNKSSYVVDLSGTSHFNTTTTGVAPQLSSTYAEYDDGANVFTEYWNFAGTTLPSAFTNLTTGGTFSYTVDNGLTLTGYSSASGTNYGLHIYTTAQYAPSIIEADIYSASLQTGVSWELAYTTTAPNTDLDYVLGYSNTNGDVVFLPVFEPFVFVSFVWHIITNPHMSLYYSKGRNTTNTKHIYIYIKYRINIRKP